MSIQRVYRNINTCRKQKLEKSHIQLIEMWKCLSKGYIGDLITEVIDIIEIEIHRS